MCENAWIETSDESEQVRMSKFRHEIIMNSEGAIALQPDIDRIHSLTLALCEQAIVVAEALRAFGNLADFGHQEKAGSVEPWIFMIFVPQKCATSYASNAMAHEMVPKRKSISVSSSFDMLMRMSCDSVSIAHISSSYAVKFPW